MGNKDFCSDMDLFSGFDLLAPDDSLFTNSSLGDDKVDFGEDILDLREKALRRHSKFKEILKSDKNFILNQRCRNVLSTFLLLGNRYLEFIDFSFKDTSNRPTRIPYRKDFNSFKTREIFKQLFNLFGIGFEKPKLLMEKCFNSYNSQAYSDFRFGDNFEYFWEVCTNRYIYLNILLLLLNIQTKRLIRIICYILKY